MLQEDAIEVLVREEHEFTGEIGNFIHFSLYIINVRTTEKCVATKINLKKKSFPFAKTENTIHKYGSQN